MKHIVENPIIIFLFNETHEIKVPISDELYEKYRIGNEMSEMAIDEFFGRIKEASKGDVNMPLVDMGQEVFSKSEIDRQTDAYLEVMYKELMDVFMIHFEKEGYDKSSLLNPFFGDEYLPKIDDVNVVARIDVLSSADI